MVVRRAMRANSVLGGAGSIEMELSKIMRESSKSIDGTRQIIVEAFAKSLEVIPRTLSINAGLDSVAIMIKLRKLHAEGKKWAGVDIS